MKYWLLLLFALMASACGTMPVPIDSRASGYPSALSPKHFIIVAVDNEQSAFVARAGGTPHGYDNIASYGPSVTARRRLRSVEHDYGLHEASAWPIKILRMHCAVLGIPKGTDVDALLATLAKDQRVRLAQPLQIFATRSQKYNDPYVGLQRGFEQMDVAGAHPWSRGEGVKVAIVDTGADILHPDLRASVESAVNFVDSDDRQFLQDRHGTEVAGVIAAVADNHEGIVGIAPKARLLLYKACWQTRRGDDAARCNSFTLARALVAAFEAGAQIINLSLTGPVDPLLSDLIREGVNRGVLFVGAAPSEVAADKEGLLHAPGVIEVASTASQSVHGSAIYAPGREILTLLPEGHYDFASGDSIATAQVTGVLALLLAKNAGLTPGNAYRLLRSTSMPSGVVGGDGTVIDACAAVVSLVGRGFCDHATLRTAETPAR